MTRVASFDLSMAEGKIQEAELIKDEGLMTSTTRNNSALSLIANTTVITPAPDVNNHLNLTVVALLQPEPISHSQKCSNLSECWQTVPFLSTEILPRLLTKEKTLLTVEVLKNVTRLFDDYGIEYVMCFGTLLGSYFSHSILPWDDDVDIMIHVKYKSILENLSHENTSINKYSLKIRPDCMRGREKGVDGKETCIMSKIKLYLYNSPYYVKHKPWKMPFVDVITYDNNSTHVWILNRPPWVFPLSVFYPLQKRPLSGLWLSAPHQPYPIFVALYFKFMNYGTHQMTCAWPFWDHWAENLRKSNRTTALCKDLVDIYPFVSRSVEPSGDIREELTIGGKVYYSITTKERFKPEWQPEIHVLKWMPKEYARSFNQEIYDRINHKPVKNTNQTKNVIIQKVG